MDNLILFALIVCLILLAIFILIFILSLRVTEMVETLKKAQAARLPHDTIEGIEDLEAMLNRVAFHREAQREYNQAIDRLLGKAIDTARLVRGREYDPETPCSQMPHPSRRDKGDRKQAKSKIDSSTDVL